MAGAARMLADLDAMSALVDRRVAHATSMSADSRLIPDDLARLKGLRAACEEARHADAPVLQTVRQALAGILFNEFSKALERSTQFERAQEQMLAAEEMQQALRVVREQAESIERQGQEIAALKAAALLPTGQFERAQEQTFADEEMEQALPHTGELPTGQHQGEETAALKAAALPPTGQSPGEELLHPYLKIIVKGDDVKYNVQYTHTKDDKGLPRVDVWLRFWDCTGILRDEDLEIRMKNRRNERGAQWRVVFADQDAADPDPDVRILENVGDFWDAPVHWCPYDKMDVPLVFKVTFEEGEYLSIFSQDDRQVVFFTTVYHNREGRDISGKMVPQGLEWTREKMVFAGTDIGSQRRTWKVYE